MSGVNFDAWTVSADGLSARHSNGFIVQVEGNPRDPDSVNPGRFPDGLSAIDQVRLLRLGVEAIARAAKSNPAPRRAPPPAPVARPKPAGSSGRPVLSMKRKGDTPGASPARGEAQESAE